MAKHLDVDELTKVVDDAITRGEYSIAKIAAALNMSERTFCRRMKELTDVTPKIFISKIQMERCARLLLAHPDYMENKATRLPSNSMTNSAVSIST